MSQRIPSETIEYERYVDRLRQSNAEMMQALELHHASHVVFEHGDDVESEKQYALAVEVTRSIVAKSKGRAEPMPAKTITIHVEGGMVQDVTGVPPGVELRVEDYDDADDTGPTWDAQKECHVTVYGEDGV